jgi:hypothetical protein
MSSNALRLPKWAARRSPSSPIRDGVDFVLYADLLRHFAVPA